jgi:Histidine kinase-, DNA gyrase B-, and HSP90-like ATPase
MNSMASTDDLRVTSHVGRDILASAAGFKTEAAVVWEYVVNSLQYVGRGVAPVVDVHINHRDRVITIADNGAGMDRVGLHHFFKMHGENLERRAGRPGRGKFGTGKSAAFGIATALEIETVQNGRCNRVELTREMIDSSRGEEIPLRWVTQDEGTEFPNGTIVTISGILLPRIDTASVIEYIERNLAFFRGVNPRVAVNTHVCEYHEPRVAETHVFHPSSSQAKVIGNVVLTVKVAQAPLLESGQGIAVTAGAGNLVAIERGGIERKEFGTYLFGDVDVPALEDPTSQIAPYDTSRSLRLNPKHPSVAVLLAFIGSKLETARKKLVEAEQAARQGEQARRLAAESDRIAQVLNEDFRDLQRRLKEIRAATARLGEIASVFGEIGPGDEDPDVWVAGVDEPGTLEPSQLPSEGEEPGGRDKPDVAHIGQPDEAGADLVSPAGGDGTTKRKRRSGFQVDYRHLGEEEDRSVYEQPTMTILINLDHPVVTAALGDGSVDDLGFRRLSYEIAFAEYSVAVGYEMSREDPAIPADDLLYEVRRTLNRVARSSAQLYR